MERYEDWSGTCDRNLVHRFHRFPPIKGECRKTVFFPKSVSLRARLIPKSSMEPLYRRSDEIGYDVAVIGRKTLPESCSAGLAIARKSTGAISVLSNFFRFFFSALNDRLLFRRGCRSALQMCAELRLRNEEPPRASQSPRGVARWWRAAARCRLV